MNHREVRPTLLLDDCLYLEAPRWRGDALYVSDIPADKVLRVEMDGTVTVIARRPGLHPSGLGWLPDGTMLVVAVLDRALLAVDPTTDVGLRTFADLSSVATSIVNDMAIDASGRAYVGMAGSDISGGEPIVAAPLVRVDPDGSVHDAGGELLCANGIVVAGAGRTLIVAETFADRLSAFDIAADGTLGPQREWARLPTGYAPDGICLDTAGGVWVACPFAERFVRVTEGGTITDELPVPDRRAIACTLGGPDGTTLFLLSWEPVAASPAEAVERASRIDIIDVVVPSAGQP